MLQRLFLLSSKDRLMLLIDFIRMFNALGINWGPAGSVLFMQIQGMKIPLLRVVNIT